MSMYTVPSVINYKVVNVAYVYIDYIGRTEGQTDRRIPGRGGHGSPVLRSVLLTLSNDKGGRAP